MSVPVAIIGINSFSGSTFAKQLLEVGTSVVGFARNTSLQREFLPYTAIPNRYSVTLEVFSANLLSDSDFIADVIGAKGCSLVLNFAAQSMVAESWVNPEDWYDTNVSGIAKLVTKLSNLKNSKIEKFIQFSTPEVYGSTAGLVKENWHFNPTTPYAISRAASDLHLRAMLNTYGFPVIFTRTANIYGSHQRLYRIIPKLVTKAIKGDKFSLHGSGASRRSFVHASDVAFALNLILKQGEIGETYHISGTEFISILDLTKKILQLLDCDFDRIVKVVGDRPGKDQAYLLDSSKIREELGWSDQVLLDEGISEVINWIKSEWSAIKDSSLEYTHFR